MYNFRKLSDLAHAKDVSNVELAKLIGKSRVTVSKFMHDKASPTIKDLEKIAKHLDVPVLYFFDEYDHKITTEKPKDLTHETTIKYMKALLDSKDREIELLKKFYEKFSDGEK